MASTLTNLLYHVVFSTKDRQSLLGSDLREDLYAYIGGVVRGERGRLLEIGGRPDHVHLLARFSPAVSLSHMLQRIKGNSSRWVNDGRRVRGRFAWQRGYAAFTVSESAANGVAEYIRDQG